MPWTFAHPAAVLPLRRYCPGYLSFPALVVGSMMPDFGYYVAGTNFATRAHSFTGILLYCLPAGLVVLCVLCLLRRPLCFMLPQPHRAALTPLAEAPITLGLRALLCTAVSLVLGACTHVIWDAFTHKRDLIGLHIAVLHEPAFQWGATAVPVYYVGQMLSTLLGAVLLLVVYCNWLRRSAGFTLYRGAAREDLWRWRLLKTITLIALLVAVTLSVDVAARFNGAFAIAVLMRCIAVYGTVAIALLGGACCVYCYWQRDKFDRYDRIG